MKVGKQFNTLTYGEYLHLIENHKKFTDFNTLGLFRSIVETTKLSLEEKLELRKVAINAFAKTFDFLQLKDPQAYFVVTTLGESLTLADEHQAWEDIKANQQRILEIKKLRHRNFGIYSKHNCPYANCPFNGVMFKQASLLSDRNMHFHTDSRNRYLNWENSDDRKKARKSKQRIISQRIIEE